MSINDVKDAIISAEEFTNTPNYDVKITCMSDVEMKPINWLWSYRIACGKLTVIAGNPGLGKSQITTMLASTVSTGGSWPDGESAPIGSVVFLSAEDDAADTIKPRLIATGADMRRCYILEAIKIKNDEGKDSERTFDLSKDIERLGDSIKQIGNVKMVIIDPISAYMGKVDSHNNSDTRGLLAPLSAMAEKHGVAIVLLTHLNKSNQQDMIARVTGSIGLIAAARAGYIVVKDENNRDLRYFLPIKNNIGNDSDGFSFKIEGVELPNDISTSKICWQEGTVDAHKILYPEQEKKPTATNGAADFLRELLSDKPMMVKDVLDAGINGAGYSKATIQRASRKIRVKRKKLGMDGGWEWSLPTCPLFDEGIEGCEDFTNISMASSKGGDKEIEGSTHKTMQSSTPSQPSQFNNS